jgi:hypothetical protein
MSSKHYLATKYTQIKDYKPMVSNTDALILFIQTPDSEFLNMILNSEQI